MGISERREREKAQLRTRIVEAARDILSEEGLDALSMRAIAERIEYSAATIYLYFQNKDELIRSVVAEGFRRLGEAMAGAVEAEGPEAGPVEQYHAMGRAYVRFALADPAYFRVMFELPGTPDLDAEECAADAAFTRETSWEFATERLQSAIDEGTITIPDPFRGAVMGWGLLHGLVSLYLGGHLADAVESREAFLEMVDEAIQLVHTGWATGRVEEATQV